MKTSWRIFLRDLSRLKKNIIAMGVIIGICVIPSLYAWFNIYANMDPYKNTGNIPVAVVNLDKGCDDKKLGHLDAGAEAEENLRANDKMGWVFTNESAALEGVYAGDYYAAIIIPETFSADLVSLFSDEIHQPKILFYSNEKKNAVAPKITGTGASTLQQGINEEFVDAVSKTAASLVLDKLNKSGDELTDSLNDIKGNISDLGTKTEKLSALLQQFRDQKTSAEKVLKNGKNALALAGETVDKAGTTGKDIDKKITESRSNLAAFSDSVHSDLSDAGQKLSDLNVAAGEKIGTLNTKIRELDQELNEKTQPVVSRIKTIQKIDSSLLDNLDTINKELAGNTTVSNVITDLREDNDRHAQMLSLLEASAKGAKDLYTVSAGLTSTINQDIASAGKTQSEALHTLDGTISNDAGTIFDRAAAASGHLTGLIESTDTDIKTLSNLLDEIGTLLNDIDKALSDSQGTVGRIRDRITQAVDDLNAIESMQVFTDLKKVTADLDPETIGQFISSPVKTESNVLYPVPNYGTGMTPFYSNLAIWVGCIVLVNIFKTEVDEDEKVNGFNLRQAYFGRWFLFVFVALIQAAIVCIGDMFLLGITAIHPVMFLLCGLWTAFVYMNIIYALTITFKHIGKALSVLLVILQIPGSSGTYPIEMMPQFFQNLHPFLPFSYGIGAMREAISGTYSYHYAKNMSILILFLGGSLLLGMLIRPLFANLNYLFDRRMAETDILSCEKIGTVKERKNLILGAQLLLADDTIRERVVARVERFEQRHQAIVRKAFLLIFLIPAVFLVLMFVIPYKLLFLVLWIISILAIILFLVILEYLKDRLDRQRQLMTTTKDELIEHMNDRNREN